MYFFLYLATILLYTIQLPNNIPQKDGMFFFRNWLTGPLKNCGSAGGLKPLNRSRIVIQFLQRDAQIPSPVA